MAKICDKDIFLLRIAEIRCCLSVKCYFAALSLALALPDICGKAEYPNGGNAARYIQWFNRYIGNDEKPKSVYSVYDKNMPYLSGEVVFNLRCSFLHAGNPGIDKEKIKEECCRVDRFNVELGEPFCSREASVSYGAGMQICHRECTFNVIQLCNELCGTAEKYYRKNREKFNFFDYHLTEV